MGFVNILTDKKIYVKENVDRKTPEALQLAS